MQSRSIPTYGPPLGSPLSVASFLLRRAISLSFLAAVVAARFVSMIVLYENSPKNGVVVLVDSLKCTVRKLQTVKSMGLSEICQSCVNLLSVNAMTLKATISQAADAVEGIERPINSTTAKSRKRFVGTSTPRASSSKTVRRVANQIPDDILHDTELNAAINGAYSILGLRE